MEDPNWTIVPPFPITARNVAIFLNMETKRMSKSSDGQSIPGTRLGVSAIKQCISALESWRRTHEHEYPNNPEALRPLRLDSRIRTHETNAGATESEWNAEAQITKALGSTADTYTEQELIRASVWCLRVEGTDQQVHLALRDRAMILMTTSTAFRGDNIRSLLLSDLYSQAVRLIEAGLDATAMALVLFSDQGKTNKTGRIDEQAAFHHRHPELCSVGALGFYLFSLFHIIARKRPLFAPDFSHGGKIGFREWYKWVLFPGSGGEMSEMTYENHCRRVNTVYTKNDITIRKSTHAGRPYAATNTREHGASSEDTKALGIWNQGAFRACYERRLPAGAMLGSADFDANRQDTYFIPRAISDPPPILTSKIFPWVEEEEAAYKQRCDKHGKNATDVALQKFLLLLHELRVIIVQDAAVLKLQYPDCSIFRYSPFNTPEFDAFSIRINVCIKEAEAQAAQQLQDMPERAIERLQAILGHQNIAHANLREQWRQDQVETRAQLDLILANQSRSKGKSRKVSQDIQANQTSTTPAPVTSHVPQPAPTSQHQVTPTEAAIETVTSTSGKEYPLTTFPLSQNDFERKKQLTAISELEGLFPVERLARHRFEWSRGVTENQEDEWLPFYTYWRPADKLLSASIRQIWNEWASGIDGQLSVMQLTSKWNARWRRNNSAAKTEASRRKKVTTLIKTLQDQQNWTIDRVLEFMESTYRIPTSSTPHLKSTRAFIDYLQKKDGVLYQEILDKAKQEAGS